METMTRTPTKSRGLRTLPVRSCCPPPETIISPETLTTGVARFKALADATRLAIVAMLAEIPEPICVCEFTESFDLEQPTISHHLKILRDAGLITSERHGSWAYYHLHPAQADWVRETLAALPR
jgi:ArsR family transcriptional regulator